MFPKLRERPRSGIERAPKRDWPRHRAFIRRHMCSVPGCEDGPIECAHIRVGGTGGTGVKPADWSAVSLCHAHHSEQHAIGHAAFDRKHGIDSVKLAAEFAARSPDVAMRETMKAEGLA